MRKNLLILFGILILLAGCNRSSRFEDYKIGKTFTVNFTFPDLALEEFSDREKADQVKDWLLFSLISNSGLKRNEIAEASFDLAPVRYGFNNSMANFDYGDTRSKFIGNGEVVALIPKSDEKKKIDNIAHILDEARKNQGEKAKTVYVFEYDLNTEGKFAKLTRGENIDAATYFTEKMGYFETKVQSLEDLKSFMDKTDDITYAKRTYDGLVFGGRHTFSQTYGKATPEDVAAIWQSEKFIQNQPSPEAITDQFNFNQKQAYNNFDVNYNVAIKKLEFDDGVSFLSLSIGEQNSLIEYIEEGVSGKFKPASSYTIGSRYKSDESVRKLISDFKKDLQSLNNEYAEKADLIRKNLQNMPVASGSGFSLDPAINFKRSIKFVNDNKYYFEDVLWPDYSVTQLLEQLEEKNGDLMEYAIAKFQDGSGLSESAMTELQSCVYQQARYDGKLEGTRVGMTLFYTDLLAKIWAANMFDSHADVNITEFKNLEQSSSISPAVFKQESYSLPACRLWFGPNKNGFQIGEGKKELTFARNATQIFALSNNPGDLKNLDSTGKSKHLEVQAAKDFEVVLNWWNDHYEEVGQFEPEYQRLNEIMKWSTVISWLNAETQNTNLDFLSAYPVDDKNWFPNWAKSQKNLKFSDWDKLVFYKKGSVGNKTEAIPLLYSTNKMFEGGVSLAEKSLIKEAPELLTAEKSLFRRANIAKEFDGENSFKTFNETKINLVDNIETKTVTIDLKPKDGYKLRNKFGEIQNNKFEWNIAESPSGEYSFKSKFAEVPIGELRASRVGENGFSIGFESQAIDKGMSIAKQCSDYRDDLAGFLGSHPSVVKKFQSETGEWYVQVKNSDEWMVMKILPEDSKGSINLEKGWQARTSGSKFDSRIVEMKWVKESEITAEVKKHTLELTKLDNVLDESPKMLKERLMKTNGSEAAQIELKKIEKEGIGKAEELAAKGEFKKAASQTEKLILHFGETQQLASMRIRNQLRAGLKEMENFNYNTAVNYLNEALTSRPASLKAGFFDDLNSYIEKASISKASKENIYNMEKAYFTDEQMFVQANWEGYKPIASQVSIDNIDLTRKGTKIIYSDNDAFRNIDPNTPFETIIDEIRKIDDIQIYDISAGKIGRNTRMYASFDPPPPPSSPGSYGLTNPLGSYWKYSRKLRFRVFPVAP